MQILSSQVRIPPGFGHQVQILSSPVRIPPGFGHQMQILSCPVRIPPGFGHPSANSFVSCPNTAWIRTLKCKFYQVKSEYRLDSDTQVQIPSCAVRIPPRFGHQVQIPSCPVRIPPGFGQPSANSFVSSPNTLWIRTPKCKFYQVLSKFPLNSDNQQVIKESFPNIRRGFFMGRLRLMN